MHVSVSDSAGVQYQFFDLGLNYVLSCPLILILKELLYLSHTEDLVLDLCPTDYCMLISCMLHPCRGKNGAEGKGKVDPMHQAPHAASHTQFRSATSTSHPSFPLRASISLGAELQFIF